MVGAPKKSARVIVAERSAVISECGRYRYCLRRRWGDESYALFIGLNPSTADAVDDDPTIRRCGNFAADWGYGGLPAAMKAAPEPVGPENDAWLARLGADAGIRVAAWGVDGSHLGRDAAALALIPDLRCLGLTKDGFPRHPLRLRRDTPPVAF